MPLPRKYVHFVGDGTTTVYNVGEEYIPLSSIAFVRGLPRWRDNDDGYFETDPVLGTFTLKEAPLLDDEVAFSFIPGSETTQIVDEVILLVREESVQVRADDCDVDVFKDEGGALVEIDSGQQVLVSENNVVVLWGCEP